MKYDRKNERTTAVGASESATHQYELPKGFERADQALNFRKDVRKGVKKLPKPRRQVLALGPCTSADRCRKGLCTVCSRITRKKLVRFAEEHQLHNRDWVMLTISIEPWKMDPGDYQSFVEFLNEPDKRICDLKPVKRLLARFKRQAKGASPGKKSTGSLLVIGSVETFLKVVGNVPHSKPFHMHFLIHGLAEAEVQGHAEALFGEKVDGGPVRPVDIETVKKTPEDFVEVLTYCFKQPFRKEVFINEETIKGRQVWAKPNELGELACNLGPIAQTDRMILVGIRYENGNFRLL